MKCPQCGYDGCDRGRKACDLEIDQLKDSVFELERRNRNQSSTIDDLSMAIWGLLGKKVNKKMCDPYGALQEARKATAQKEKESS